MVNRSDFELWINNITFHFLLTDALPTPQLVTGERHERLE